MKKILSIVLVLLMLSITFAVMFNITGNQLTANSAAQQTVGGSDCFDQDYLQQDTAGEFTNIEVNDISIQLAAIPQFTKITHQYEDSFKKVEWNTFNTSAVILGDNGIYVYKTSDSSVEKIYTPTKKVNDFAFNSVNSNEIVVVGADEFLAVVNINAKTVVQYNVNVDKNVGDGGKNNYYEGVWALHRVDFDGVAFNDWAYSFCDADIRPVDGFKGKEIVFNAVDCKPNTEIFYVVGNDLVAIQFDSENGAVKVMQNHMDARPDLLLSEDERLVNELVYSETDKLTLNDLVWESWRNKYMPVSFEYIMDNWDHYDIEYDFQSTPIQGFDRWADETPGENWFDLHTIKFIDNKNAYVGGSGLSIFKLESETPFVYVDVGWNQHYKFYTPQGFFKTVYIGQSQSYFNTFYNDEVNGVINFFSDKGYQAKISTQSHTMIDVISYDNYKISAVDYNPATQMGMTVGAQGHVSNYNTKVNGFTQITGVTTDLNDITFGADDFALIVGEDSYIASYSSISYKEAGEYISKIVDYTEYYEKDVDIGAYTASWNQDLDGNTIDVYVKIGNKDWQIATNGRNTNLVNDAGFGNGLFSTIQYKIIMNGDKYSTPMMDSFKIDATIYVKPEITISTSPGSTIFSNETINFEVEINSPTTGNDYANDNWEFRWDFGDQHAYLYDLSNTNIISLDHDPSYHHVYPVPGEYIATLQVFMPESHGGYFFEQSVFITVKNKAPVAIISALENDGEIDQNREIRANTLVFFYSSLSYDPDPVPGANLLEYTWDWGDGEQESTSQSARQHKYVTEGDYNVKLTVTDSLGASSSKTISVSVTTHNLAPIAIITEDDLDDGFAYRQQIYNQMNFDGSASQDDIQGGDSGIYQDNIVKWEWTIKDVDGNVVTTLSGPEVSWTPSKAGYYDLTLAVTDDDDASDDGLAQPKTGIKTVPILVQYPPLQGDWHVYNYTFVEKFKFPGTKTGSIGTFDDSIIIHDGGHLILSETEIYFQPTDILRNKIEVQAGGILSVTNRSVIDTILYSIPAPVGQPSPSRYYYLTWEVAGDIYINDSFIGHVGDLDGNFNGMVLRYGSNAYMQNSVISDCLKNGLTIYTENEIIIKNSGIQNCIDRYEDATGSAFAIEQKNDNGTLKIINCDGDFTVDTVAGKSYETGFSNNDEDLRIISTNTLVENNIFKYGKLGSSITVDGCAPVIKNNTIYHPGLIGIEVSQNSAPTINNNNIIGQGKTTIGVYTTSDLTINNTNIENCYRAMENRGISTTLTAINNRVQMNNFECLSVKGSVSKVYYYTKVQVFIGNEPAPQANVSLYINGLQEYDLLTGQDGSTQQLFLLSRTYTTATGLFTTTPTYDNITVRAIYKNYYQNRTLILEDGSFIVIRFQDFQENGAGSTASDDDSSSNAFFDFIGTDSPYWIALIIIIILVVALFIALSIVFFKNYVLVFLFTLMGIGAEALVIINLRGVHWAWNILIAVPMAIILFNILRQIGLIPANWWDKIRSIPDQVRG